MATVVKDLLGNEVKKGSLLFWAPVGAVAKVLELGADTLTLGIVVPFNASGPHTHLKEFVAVVNPADQQIAFDALKEQAKLDASMAAAGAK